jgi:hypothetical protein
MHKNPFRKRGLCFLESGFFYICQRRFSGIMTLTEAAIKILKQLGCLVAQIDESDFIKPSKTLGGSTIGQHLRHTIEFFICFETGCKHGLINYDQRGRDRLMETDKTVALQAIDRVTFFVSGLELNRILTLEVGYDPDKEMYVGLNTNAARELVYNIEHAVHHMAIMKIGANEIAPYLKLDDDFGIAVSTMRAPMEAALARTSH